jgi:hypothetical protein
MTPANSSNSALRNRPLHNPSPDGIFSNCDKDWEFTNLTCHQASHTFLSFLHVTVHSKLHRKIELTHHIASGFSIKKAIVSTNRLVNSERGSIARGIRAQPVFDVNRKVLYVGNEAAVVCAIELRRLPQEGPVQTLEPGSTGISSIPVGGAVSWLRWWLLGYTP